VRSLRSGHTLKDCEYLLTSFVGFPKPSPFVVDVNGDGVPDVIVGSYPAGDEENSGVQVFLNDGHGRLSARSLFFINHGYDTPIVAVADFDHDGHVDVLAGTASGYKDARGELPYVLTGNGDGTFSPAERVPYSIETLGHLRSPAADYNHDGWFDYPLMTITNDSVNQVVMLMGSPEGLQIGSVKSAPCCNLVDAAVTADFNRDGNADLALEYPNAGASTAVLFGRGDGTFQNARDYATDGPGFGMQVADLNGDGVPDLLTSAAIRMINDGHGYFKAPVITQTGGPGRALSVSIAKADFNRDGIEDVVLLAHSAPGSIVRVFNGTGRGYYDPGRTYPVGAVGDLVCTGDVNGDGFPDIVVVSPDSAFRGHQISDISVLLGRSGGGFAPAKNAKIFPEMARGTYNRNVFLADMYHDGKHDLVAEWGIAFGNGDGTFRRPARCAPQAMRMPISPVRCAAI